MLLQKEWKKDKLTKLYWWFDLFFLINCLPSYMIISISLSIEGSVQLLFPVPMKPACLQSSLWFCLSWVKSIYIMSYTLNESKIKQQANESMRFPCKIGKAL